MQARARLLGTITRTNTHASLKTPRTNFIRAASSAHGQESFEAFSERYVKFFQSVQDIFELQRGLNNCFAHDLVPSVSVIEAALKAARRVDDYSTAVRIFEGIKEKVENNNQYEAYLTELKPLKEELGEYSSAMGNKIQLTLTQAWKRKKNCTCYSQFACYNLIW
jgi:cytochrome c oxidase subunit 5a